MNHITGTFAVGLYAVQGIPLVQKGQSIGQLIVVACRGQGMEVHDNDVIVVAQKIVSKAEGRVVDLSTIVPSEAAQELADKTGRDPRLCQVYINESAAILGTKGRMVITRHRLGFECTGAGVDRSNVAPHSNATVALLPLDPDLSARRIRATIRELTGHQVAVVINDSFGKADREGSIGTSIGFCGIRYVESRSQQDLYGNPSKSSIALVDEIAAAASLVMGQSDEAIPVVIIRGARYTVDESTGIRDLLITP